MEQINLLGGDMERAAISAENFAKIVRYFNEGRLNNLAAKKTLSLSMGGESCVDEIIEREKLVQVSDSSQLISVVEAVIRDNKAVVAEFCQGKLQAIQFLVGQVMKKTNGQANPKIARSMLEETIKRG